MMRLLLTAAALSATATNAASIPKTIIQTSQNKAIDRPDWIEYRASLKANNPDFAIVHFDDDEAKAYIAKHYGDTVLEHAYDMATPIMKADLFRLAIIYEQGGFYMDMDMLAKSSFDPLVDAINDGSNSIQAVFPKEWWMSDEFYRKIFPGKGGPKDEEDHWQMGQYAFAAVPGHPFVKDALEEAIVRSVNLMRAKGDDLESIRDGEILAATGPYLFTELYHAGRKEGKYEDVLHLEGDSTKPILEHRHGGPDWHKFGPYAEHMLSHTWTKPERRGLQEYDEYGIETEAAGAESGLDSGSGVATFTSAFLISALAGVAGLLVFA